MRIVKYGHIKPIEHFCTGCGCTFEYIPRDIKELGNGMKVIYCPVCGRGFRACVHEFE